MTRILVVDDDPQIQEALSVALPLSDPDATITTASSGEEALRIFAEQAPDVVVVDASLPGLSGFDVVRQIRQASDVPVVMLNGAGEVEQVRGFQLGADDYVAKPFGPRVLAERIKAVRRRTDRSPRQRGGPDSPSAR